MNETLFLEILQESYEREFAEFDNVPEHKFSLKHRLAMKRIFARYARNVEKTKQSENKRLFEVGKNNRHLSIKQRLLIAVLIVFLMTMLVGWVVVFISQNFSGTVYTDNTCLSAVNLDNCPQRIEFTYVLSNVPEGFELVETTTSLTNTYTLYVNHSTKQEITLCQWVKKYYKPHYNTEYNDLEEVNINGSVGLCIDFSDDTHCHSLVTWDNGDYITEIVADFDKYETVNLAKVNKV